MGDSLFGSDEEDEPSASLPIEGAYHFPALLSEEIQSEALQKVAAFTGASNQCMLWGQEAETLAAPLLRVLPDLLRPTLPEDVYALLFDSGLTLQVIVNLYEPGEGITPHVDLLSRYGDGILGVSFLSSALMQFHEDDQLQASVLLRPGDVYILSGSARYDYKHGIPFQLVDTYTEEGIEKTLVRGRRISITLRRMLQGADQLGFLDSH